MKKTILFFLLAVTNTISFAQPDANTLHNNGRTLMQQGDFENALQTLEKALQLQPADIEIMKDIAYTNYLKRDFGKAIETGKNAVANPDADVQSFQILGLSYKAIADENSAGKMYKTALKKFPKSGVLCSEYGDLLSEAGNKNEAIKLWEKGIEMDANASGNYYFATKYYAEKGNVLWVLLYGETFVNIESLTKRTQEIKILLLDTYKKIFSNSSLITSSPSGNEFEKAVTATFSKVSSMISGDITPESVTALRTRFILEWSDKNTSVFPFRLFDHHRLLLQTGYFDAYNQWLVGPAIDGDKLQTWMANHAEDVSVFQQFQRSTLFKIPEGQYYGN